MQTTPQQQAVLDQFGKGWRLISIVPPTDPLKNYPPGSEQWNVVNAEGKPAPMIVQAGQTGGGVNSEVGTGTYTQTPATADYTVVQSPEGLVPTPPASANAPQEWTQQFTSTNGGVTTRYGTNTKTGKVEQIPGAPTETKPGTTPPDKLEQIKDPNTGKVVKLRDPISGTVIDLPDAAKDATPRVPTTFGGPNGSQYSWDGTTAKLLIAGTAPKAEPKEGDTQKYAIPGTNKLGQQVYHNGVWGIDATYTPTDYVPSDKPKENDVRPNTDSKGQKVQEIYKGGSWVTDTSVAPTPFGTQAPTTLNTGTAPFIVQQDPTTGKTTNIANPNTTDVAARVGQLQAAAREQRDALNAAVKSGAKTPEQAATEFDGWWATNVDPVSQELQRTQQQATYDAQNKQQEQQRLQQATDTSSLSTAQQAGQNAVSNATNFGAGVEQVGPGYGAALGNVLSAFSSGKAPGPIDGGGLTWAAPDMNDIATKATAAALAHISPTAAQIAGRPMPQVPQGLDVAGALNKTSYAPSTTIAPDGTITVQHAPTPPPAPPAPLFMSGAFSGANYQPPQYTPPAVPQF